MLGYEVQNLLKVPRLAGERTLFGNKHPYEAIDNGELFSAKSVTVATNVTHSSF